MDSIPVQMNKVVFLDFDGVLTSEPFTRQCIFEYRRESRFGLDWFDPDCIEHLRTIVDATGAKIVVSSSWRDLGIDKLRIVWSENDMPGELIGTTPIWVLTKVSAIKEFLKQYPCDSYVVLDDSDLHLPNQVKTDPHTGLVDKNVIEAISILNNTEDYVKTE